MTKFQLMNSLMNNAVIKFIPRELSNWDCFEGIVTAIQREDGSGNCWNVTAFDQKTGYKTIFVRTID